MGKTYQIADRDVYDLAADIVTRHRPELAAAGLTYQIVMVYPAYDDAGKPKGAALTHGGYPALGKVKVNGLKDRVKGLPDVTVEIDGEHWKDADAVGRRSLLHHELYHVELDGEADDAGRPKVTLRKHDVQVGVFTELVAIYKDQGVDTRAVAEANERLRLVQDVFKFWG